MIDKKVYRVLDDGQSYAVIATSLCQAVSNYKEWRRVYWDEADVEDPDGGVLEEGYCDVIEGPPYSPREEDTAAHGEEGGG